MVDGQTDQRPAQAAPTVPEASDVAGAAEAKKQDVEAGRPGLESQRTATATVRDGGEHVSALREWIGFVCRVGFWALLLYLFVFQVSVVEGPSMQPNFQTNDRLVIDKLTYRLVPVRRFDVIVFQAIDMHAWRAQRESKDYIKRVIGLPGENVVLKGGQTFVEGQLIDEPYGPNPMPHFMGAEEFQVPPHYYFVMGDNRGDSKDSRSEEMGFVPESQIRGLVRLRFAPLNRWKWFGRY
jgi:signal peptidase I